MKKFNNIIFLALAAAAMLFCSCAQKEELNLTGVPSSSAGLTIDGDDTGSYQIDLEGVYDSEGVLGVSGSLSRTYTFALASPSLEDVLLKIEPIAVNIPEENYVVSATNLVIPAGERAASVSVALNMDENGNDDLSFMLEEFNAMTYELGVRLVSMNGTDVVFEGEKEAKAVLDKVAYVSTLTPLTNGKNEVSFKRSFATDEILDEEDMTIKFRVYLDRPAKTDVKVSFNTEGLADAFKADAVFTPSEVTIPAGYNFSDEITWTVTDDFLETTTDPEKHTLKLNLTTETSDPAIVLGEGITVNVEKVKNIITALGSIEDGWIAYDRGNWTVKAKRGEADFVDVTSTLTDGSTYSDYGSGDVLIVEVDMGTSQAINGIVVDYYAKSYYYASNIATFQVSDDGNDWTTIGSVEGRIGSRIVKLLAPTTARYIRYEGVPYSYIYIAEFNVYHK